MSSAFHPTVASSTTSSVVKQAPRPTMANSALEGAKPLTNFGGHPQPTGNPHVADGMGFHTPSHGSTLLSGAQGAHIQNPEMRNATNGVAHISMKPGKM